MRIIEIMLLLIRKGLTVGSLPSSLLNSLIVLVMFPILQQKMPLEMDLVWTIPTMTKPQTIFRLHPQELLTLIILQKFPMQLLQPVSSIDPRNVVFNFHD